jgi:hypothetical protein
VRNESQTVTSYNVSSELTSAAQFGQSAAAEDQENNMGAAKVKKQNNKYPTPTNKVVPFRSKALAPVSMYFVENIARDLDFHRATCKDPQCDESIVHHDPRFKVVAILKSGHPKEVFLAPYGRGSKEDYQPYRSFQLATGEEIAGFFNNDGNTEAGDCCHEHNDKTPICITLMCHNKGIDYVVDTSHPESVFLVCAEPSCRRPLRSPGFEGKFKLAAQPKAQYPNIWCDNHGIQPSYIACTHVLEGEEPMILERPDSMVVGLAVCGDSCSDALAREDCDVSQYHRICAGHLNDRLNGRLEDFHKEAEASATSNEVVELQ